MKYKLIATTSFGDTLTKEYANIAENLKDAALKAETLRKHFEKEYPNCQVECLPYDEWNYHPSADYRVWRKDMYGDTGWWWMKMGTFARIGLYRK